MLTKVWLFLCFTIAKTTSPIGFKYFDHYNRHLKKYNKYYDTTADYWTHYYAFESNMDRIEEHNSRESSWKLGENNFTDLTFEDFKQVYLGSNPTKSTKNYPLFIKGNLSNVTNVDWRVEGLVTGIKDQKQCGSCWAFSAVGSMEGAHAKKTGNLVSLSEQNLVDCSQNYGCEGCSGGWMNAAMEYVHYNGGIDTEDEYPYEAQDGNCMYKKNESGATVKSVVNITAGDTDALLNAVSTIGPISVAIDAEYDFQLYKSGIYKSTECSKESLDHGVLIVGFGENSKGEKYYIIKNSWGTSWGVDGYIYWNRDIPNMCGIAQAASFPIV